MKTIAIIGATGFALKRLIPQMAESKTGKIVAISGRSGSRLKAIAQEFGIDNYYTDAKSMLKARSYDAVYVCTPPFLHLEALRLLAPLDCAVLCEKPLAFDISEAQEIGNLYKDRKAPLFLGHHLRHQKLAADLIKIIDSGRIGEVQSAYGQLAFFFSPLSRRRWKKEGGAASDLGSHVIDTFRFLFGEADNVVSISKDVSGWGAPDNVIALFDYGESRAIMEVSFTMKKPDNGLVIYGTRGTIRVPKFFGELSAPHLIIDEGKGTEIIEYEEELLYRNEMENVLGEEPRGVPATNLSEAINEMLFIGRMRSNK